MNKPTVWAVRNDAMRHWVYVCSNLHSIIIYHRRRQNFSFRGAQAAPNHSHILSPISLSLLSQVLYPFKAAANPGFSQGRRGDGDDHGK